MFKYILCIFVLLYFIYIYKYINKFYFEFGVYKDYFILV